MLGPIDYIVVSFEGNNFDGSILKELQKASESGAVRVVDLLFIIKNDEGTVAVAEVEDQSDDLREVAAAIGHDGDLPLISEDDINKLGGEMKNNTSAAVLVIEQLWAKGLKKALLDAGAELVDEGRIHPDKISAAVEELEETKE